jgi:hypothetical protein
MYLFSIFIHQILYFFEYQILILIYFDILNRKFFLLYKKINLTQKKLLFITTYSKFNFLPLLFEEVRQYV